MATSKKATSTKKELSSNLRSDVPVINGTAGNDIISGTAASEQINGLAGNDTIYSAQGNDTINGGAGANTLVFKAGNGNDVIINGGGNDTVALSYQYDLTFTYNMNTNDLVMGYGNNDTITYKDFCVNNSHSAMKLINGTEYLNFYENHSANALDKYGMTILATSGNDNITGSWAKDHIYAGDGNDVINARGGNDIIDSGSGNDIIIGGAGNDTYLFKNGDGKDIIMNGKPWEKELIIFQSTQELKFTRDMSNNDLIISYGEEDSVTLSNYFNANGHSVKFVKNGEDVVASVSDLLNANGYDKINDNSGSNITNLSLSQLSSEVAGWLNKTGFECAQDALESKAADDITAILAQYQGNQNLM